MIDKIKTGRNIAALRRKAGFSQAALAEKLGVSTQAVSKWECGLALPDVELLTELSWIFGVTINSLLDNAQDKRFTREKSPLPDSAACLLHDKGHRKLLRAVAPFFGDAELTELARQAAAGDFAVECAITACSGERRRNVRFDLAQISEETLCELAPYLSEAAGIAAGDISREIKRVSEFLACPLCGEKLELRKSGDEMAFFCANGHNSFDGFAAKIVDGVICFGTREIPGEQWSLSLRNYEHYLEWQNAPGNPNYRRGKPSGDAVWEKLNEIKPKVILDIASGMGGGIGRYIGKIDWRCMIILTDLSYRILSWDKRYFETVLANPHVELVYIACDCSRLPILAESIDAVLSHCGFESMQHKRMDGFAEGYRVLKSGGAAIYGMSIVEDKSSDNSRKWMELTRSLGLHSDKEFGEQYVEIGEWVDSCQKIGYLHTSTEKLYGELAAPEGDVFPFENEIMQWMCEYVCVSMK